jgi:hypothetical protein
MVARGFRIADAYVEVDIDQANLAKAVAEAKAQLNTITDKAITLDIDKRRWGPTVRAINKDLADIQKRAASGLFNQRELDQAVARVKARFTDLQQRINIHVDTSEAMMGLKGINMELTEAKKNAAEFRLLGAGLGGLGTGGQRWWMNWAHWIIAGGAELAAVVLPATVALGSAAFVVAQGTQQAYEHMTSLWKAAEATDKYLHTTFGQALGLRDVLQQAQDAADPKVYQAIGAALDIAKQHAYGLAQVGTEVVSIFDKFLAHMQYTLQQGMGGTIQGLLKEAVPDLTMLGQILGNIGHALLNLAAAMPGLAEVLLKFLDALSVILVKISELPTWILTTVLALEEFWRWGGAVAAILSRLVGLFEKSGLALALFTRYGRILGTVLGFLPTVLGLVATRLGVAMQGITAFGGVIGKAGGMLGKFGTALTGVAAALTPGMSLGIAAGIAAIIGLYLWVSHITDATDRWTTSTLKLADAAHGITTLQTITNALAQTNTKLVTAQQKYNDVTAHTEKQTAAIAVRFGEMNGAQQRAAQDTYVLSQAHQRLVGQMRNVIVGAAALASQYRTSFIGAMVLATNAGVKLQNGITGQGQAASIARIQIADYVAGLRAMGTPMGAIGKDMNALGIQTGLAATKVQQLNSAWDEFMGNVTGGTNAFSQFQLAMQGLGQTALKNTASLKGTISSIDLVKKSATNSTTAANGFATSLDGLGQNAAQTWQQFNAVLTGPGQQMLDWLRTAGAEGQLTSKDFTTAVRAMIAQLLPMAEHSKTATAELSAMAQQAGGPFTTNFKTLRDWVMKGHHSMGDFGKIVDSTTQKMADMDKVAQALSTSMRNNIIQTMTMAQLKASGLTDATQKLTDYINKNGTAGLKQSGVYKNVRDILIKLTGSQSEADSILKAYTGRLGTGNSALQDMHDKLKAARDMQDKYNQAIKDGNGDRTTLINDLGKIGLDANQSTGKIADMIHKITGIPKNVILNILMHGDGSYHITQVAQAGGRARESPTQAPAGGRALGGPITEGTTPTADDVTIKASRGEWVIRESSSRMYGSGAMKAVNEGRAVIGYARGGPILSGNQDVLSGKWATDLYDYFKSSMLSKFIDQLFSALRKAELAASGGGAVVKDAMRWLGKIPYVWGGSAVPGGADCSGFVQTIYRGHGVSAPRTSEAQYAWVRRGSPVPGGLAFYNNPQGGPPPGHVAIVGFDGNVISQGGPGLGPILAGLHAPGMLMGTGTPPGGFPGGRGAVGGREGGGQLGQLWISAGGPVSASHTMGAIAMAESGGNPRATGPFTPGGNRAMGLWQILMPANAGFVHGNVFNEMVNARAAVAIWRAQGYRAWETYTNGAYLRYYGNGTMGAAPGWGVVGERGPELVNFRGGEAVVPMMTGMSGGARMPGYWTGTVDAAVSGLRGHGYHVSKAGIPSGFHAAHPTTQPWKDMAALVRAHGYSVASRDASGGGGGGGGGGHPVHHTAAQEHAAGAAAARGFVHLKTTAEATKAIERLMGDIHKYFTGEARRRHEHTVRMQEHHLKNAVAHLQKIDSAIAGAKQYKADVLSSLSGYADLSTTMVGSGYVNGKLMSGGAFLNWQLQQRVTNLKKFAAVLKKLGQKHVPASIVKQVVALGPDAGLEYANEILAGGSDLIKTLSKTEAQITAEEQAVAGYATSAAYGGGGRLNFLSGLRHQRAGIEREVQHWAKVFGQEAGRWFGVPKGRMPKRYQTGGTIPIGESGFVGEGGIEFVTSTPGGAVVQPLGDTAQGRVVVVQNFYGPQHPTPEQRRVMAVEMSLSLGVAP